MAQDKLIYKDLSYKIIGTLFDVSNELGFGYQEKYYEEAVAKSLKDKNVQYKRQISYDLTFHGEKIGNFRLDFLIENKIVLEIKTGKRFSKQNFDQAKAYLTSTNKNLAILAIFTLDAVRFYRVLNVNNKNTSTKAKIHKINLRKLLIPRPTINP